MCNLFGYTMKISSRYHRLLIYDVKRATKIDCMGPFKRLVEQGKTKTSPWKYIPLYHPKNIGETRAIGTNFNIKLLSIHIPSFYKSCLSDWAKLLGDESHNIMSPSVVSNTYIPG